MSRLERVRALLSSTISNLHSIDLGFNRDNMLLFRRTGASLSEGSLIHAGPGTRRSILANDASVRGNRSFRNPAPPQLAVAN
jgi:hypothetical protein